MTLIKQGLLLGVIVAVVVACGVAPVAPVQAGRDAVAEYKELFTSLDRGTNPANLPPSSSWPRHELLESYLRLEVMLRPGYSPTTKELKKFHERWPTHPQIYRIKRLLDIRIAEEGSDSEALTWFEQRPPRFSVAKLRYLQLLIQAERFNDAEVYWRGYYRSGADIPSDLRDKVRRFFISQEDNELRAKAMLKSGKRDDFQRLIDAMPAPRKKYFQAWEAAVRGLQVFDSRVAKLDPVAAKDPDLWLQRISVLRSGGHDDKAEQLLLGPQGGYVAPEERQRLRFKLGRDLLLDKKEVARAFKMLDLNFKEAGGKLEDSAWFAGYSALQLGKQGMALERFMRLAQEAPSPQRRSQGAYWAAKLLRESGGDPKPWLDLAVPHQETIYGQLAMEERDGQVRFIKKRRLICRDFEADPELAPHLERMRVLAAVGRGEYNRHEIKHMTREHLLHKTDQLCLARLFDEPNLAVKLAIELVKGGRTYWEALFPTPGWESSRGPVLDKSLTWAIIRQESMYWRKALSSAGASGLMQLMPATARWEANKIGMPVPSKWRLQTPGYNMSLGESYMARQVRAFGGDLVLATAAYNAGPGRASKWRVQRNEMDGPSFMEWIPITETRGYVQKVVAGAVAYDLAKNGVATVKELVEPSGSAGKRYLVAQ